MTKPSARRLLAAALLTAATVAHAVPMHGPHTNPGQGAGVGNTATSLCSASDLGGLASDCLGYVDGNDSNSALATLANGAQWHGLVLDDLAQYKDETKGSGSTTPLFDVRQSPDDASRGVLTFLQTMAGPFVLTLKGGDTWAAYYVAGGATAGTTVQFDIPGEQGRGLSHASVYSATAPSPTRSTDLPPPGNAVPEPATAALVLLALGAVGGSRWQARRRLPQA